MENPAEELCQPLGNQKSLEYLRMNIENKFPFYLEMGCKYSDNSTEKTMLQEIIENFLILPMNTYSYCSLMLIQSKNLPSRSYNEYLKYSVKLFCFADQQQLYTFSKQKDSVTLISALAIHIATNLNKVNSLLKSLIRAANLLSIDGFSITPLHSHVVQACLSAKNISVGLRFIKQFQPLQIDPTLDNPANYVLFFYYSGLLHLSIEHYDNALACFTEAISIPSQCVSSICVAALCKAKLVSLLHSGDEYIVPKYVSLPIQRYGVDEMNVYNSISKCYLRSDVSALEQQITEYRNELKKIDGDVNISDRLITSISVHKLHKLLLAFSNVQLDKLLKYAQIESLQLCEDMVVSIIRAHDLNVKIDKINKCIIEYAGIQQSNSVSSLLLSHLQSLNKLHEKIYLYRKEIMLSNNFLSEIIVKNGTKIGD